MYKQFAQVLQVYLAHLRVDFRAFFIRFPNPLALPRASESENLTTFKTVLHLKLSLKPEDVSLGGCNGIY